MSTPKFEFLTPIAVMLLNDIGDGPLFPQTPEEALAAGVGAE